MSKLRILLIDDQPRDYDIEVGTVVLPQALALLFDVFWIQNCSEGKRFLDAFQMLDGYKPRELGKLGLPAELIVFDYALGQAGSFERASGEPTDITELLFDKAEELGIDIPLSSRGAPGVSTGKDKMGCYIGVLTARSFGSYPCGAVPATAFPDLSGSDALFFEWLNEAYFRFKAPQIGVKIEQVNPFDDKTPPYTWADSLPKALASLRDRFLILAKSKQLHVNADILGMLADSPAHCIDSELTFYTKYGKRSLPVKGLFADLLVVPEAPTEERFVEIARSWAKDLMEELGLQKEKYRQAKRIAHQFYVASESEEAENREELSNLLFFRDSGESWIKKVQSKCDALGIDLESCLDIVKVMEANDRTSPGKNRVPTTCPFPNRRHTLPSLKDAAKDDTETIRLVALMLLALTDSLNEELLNGDPISHLRVFEPLPEHFLTYSVDKDRRANSLYRMLQRLGTARGASGNFGLDFGDVRASRLFDCEVCLNAQKKSAVPIEPWKLHVGEDGRYSHGATEEELILVRDFLINVAGPKLGIAKQEKQWPHWVPKLGRA